MTTPTPPPAPSATPDPLAEMRRSATWLVAVSFGLRDAAEQVVLPDGFRPFVRAVAEHAERLRVLIETPPPAALSPSSNPTDAAARSVEGRIVGGEAIPGVCPTITVEADAFPGPIQMNARVRVTWPSARAPGPEDDAPAARRCPLPGPPPLSAVEPSRGPWCDGCGLLRIGEAGRFYCSEADWAGWVDDPKAPPCGGVARMPGPAAPAPLVTAVVWTEPDGDGLYRGRCGRCGSTWRRVRYREELAAAHDRVCPAAPPAPRSDAPATPNEET
jgi:hypothetical protein